MIVVVRMIKDTAFSNAVVIENRIIVEGMMDMLARDERIFCTGLDMMSPEGLVFWRKHLGARRVCAGQRRIIT